LSRVGRVAARGGSAVWSATARCRPPQCSAAAAAAAAAMARASCRLQRVFHCKQVLCVEHKTHVARCAERQERGG
jgi:hypothetical protein